MDEQGKSKPEEDAQGPAELSDQELEQVAGGVKWEMSEFDAAKTEVSIETLEIAHIKVSKQF